MNPQPAIVLAAVVVIVFAWTEDSLAEGLSTQTRQDLLRAADNWSVPQPKPDAKLVKIWAYQTGASASEMKPVYALGFIEPGDPKRALVGWSYWDLKDRSSDMVLPVADLERLSLDDVTPASWFEEVNFGLLTGIQLLRLKHDKLGTALIEKALAASAGHRFSAVHAPGGEGAVLTLARACLAAAVMDISSQRPDYAAIKKRVERLAKDQPELKETTDWLLESLAANVARPQPAVGTMERVVDDYLNGGGSVGIMSGFGNFSPAERTLIAKGFDAIPTLLKERHSIRFTNHRMQAFNNFPGGPMNAQQVISSYLQRFANYEFENDWLDRQRGAVPDDKPLLDWWRKASALGEQAYVARYAVAVDKDKGCRVSFEMLLLAERRYPTLLPGMYRKILETEHPSWPVLDAITRSKAIAEEPLLELLRAGLATNRGDHRNYALGVLQDIRPAQADQELVRLLRQAPATAAKEYWTDQDAGLTWYVSKSSNPKVWEALHALLEKADLGMRMELIHHLKPPATAPAEVLQSFHSIYRRWHDDTTVRDEASSEKYDGPGAGFPHERIELRDFIHEHWARWLELEVKPLAEGATAADWQKYRAAVQAGMRQRGL